MRMANFQENLAACGGDLVQMSESYKSFGLHKVGGAWTYCEWMPYAKEVFLVGDFNGWDTSTTPLSQETCHDCCGINLDYCYQSLLLVFIDSFST